jgi:hypothetical protein
LLNDILKRLVNLDIRRKLYRTAAILKEENVIFCFQDKLQTVFLHWLLTCNLLQCDPVAMTPIHIITENTENRITLSDFTTWPVASRMQKQKAARSTYSSVYETAVRPHKLFNR